MQNALTKFSLNDFVSFITNEVIRKIRKNNISIAAAKIYGWTIRVIVRIS